MGSHRVIGKRVIGIFKAIFMHDPVSFLAVRGSATVEHQRFTHSDLLIRVTNALVSSGGLPEPGVGGSIGSRPCWVFPVLMAEKVPLVLWRRPYPAFLCFHIIYKLI